MRENMAGKKRGYWDFRPIFEPKSIAVIGASRNPSKIGHAITKNFLDSGFDGPVYPVNPTAEPILGLKTYPKVADIKNKVDCVIVSVPAQYVEGVLKECGEKGVKGAVVITGGFGEVGNIKGEQAITKIVQDYGITMIGPNCLGVLNPAHRVDSIFIPVYKMGRPPVGGVSFISQSGAIGCCILDLAAKSSNGVSKFVSYGNASSVDETDLLEYLGNDDKTDIIVSYIEGVKRGREFLETAKEVTKKKPVVMIKAGMSKQGAEATMSHTGALAGSAEAYKAVFKQAKIVEATTLKELFYYTKIFSQPLPKGRNVGIVTNGGGYGVLCADAIEQFGLKLAPFTNETRELLNKNMPSYANVRNPLDIIGDADATRYRMAIDALMNDPTVDVLAVVILWQTVGIDSSVVNVVVKAADQGIKPVIVISTGGDFTQVHSRIFDSYGIPAYDSPTSAMKSIAHAANYAEYQITLKK